MEYVDNLVIGGGVIGLAIGAALSHNRTTLVVEQNALFGEHTSSRNSEVIHAGIYYPEHSLKATLCVQGRSLLYQHCRDFHIPFKQIGKLIVATNYNETTQLADIKQRAEQNGVTDLQWLTDKAIATQAPELSISSALLSPSTGIIDSHQLMLSFITQIEQNHSVYVGNTQFVKARALNKDFDVTLDCSGERLQIRCRNVINAGGLFAQTIASRIEGLCQSHIPQLHYCRGQYFAYNGKHPFNQLIYPIPEQHGLGIHATLDLNGQLKFGPDTQFIEQLDYRVDELKKSAFVAAIKRFWPTLDERKLQCDYAGIRPKLTRTGEQDFVIQSEQIHNIRGLINLFGIESPGLTASMAIAQKVARLVD